MANSNLKDLQLISELMEALEENEKELSRLKAENGSHKNFQDELVDVNATFKETVLKMESEVTTNKKLLENAIKEHRKLHCKIVNFQRNKRLVLIYCKMLKQYQRQIKNILKI